MAVLKDASRTWHDFPSDHRKGLDSLITPRGQQEGSRQEGLGPALCVQPSTTATPNAYAWACTHTCTRTHTRAHSPTYTSVPTDPHMARDSAGRPVLAPPESCGWSQSRLYPWPRHAGCSDAEMLRTLKLRCTEVSLSGLRGTEALRSC